MKNDISNKQDIEILIQKFYNLLIENSEMKHFFDNVNFQKHLPRMCDFWDFIIFNTNDVYKGSLMPIHQHIHTEMPFSELHFKIWLETFISSVDANFEGKNAELAKQAAKDIGSTMKYKILGFSGKKFDFEVVSG